MEQVDLFRNGAEVLARLAVNDQARIALGARAGEAFDDGLAAALRSSKGGEAFLAGSAGRLSQRDFAGVFACLDSFSQKRLRERLDEVAPGAIASIEGELLSFDDLETMEKRSVSAVLHEVDDRTIAQALHGAGPYMHVNMYAALGVERARVVKNLFEVSGPVPYDEVEAAQRSIESAARRLVDAGTIAGPPRAAKAAT